MKLTTKQKPTTSIPLVDLKAQYEDLHEEINDALRRECAATDFILGQIVQKFEAGFAKYLGVKYCVSVGNGTDALHLALRALGVRPGDEVILPANTYIATALAVTHSGAIPVLVDCDERTANLNVDKIRNAITRRTKAIIPVHLYGQPVDMDGVLKIARENGLKVLEDAAHAHGAKYKNQYCGLFGDAAAFSFYPGKNLGAFGDGGAIVTQSEELAEKLRLLRNFGSPRKYVHEITGFNSRLDSLQAAVLSVKLPHLDEWNRRRLHGAHIYRERLAGLEDKIRFIETSPDTTVHAYHLFVIRVLNGRRDEVLTRLQEKGIGALIHYPVPIHLQPAYQSLGIPTGSFPVSEKMCEEILSLPLCPYLTEANLEYISEELAAILKSGKASGKALKVAGSSS